MKFVSMRKVPGHLNVFGCPSVSLSVICHAMKKRQVHTDRLYFEEGVTVPLVTATVTHLT